MTDAPRVSICREPMFTAVVVFVGVSDGGVKIRNSGLAPTWSTRRVSSCPGVKGN
ncbi:hypothetical protein JYT96_00515 [Gammaproteobacteria bacterium AH-315-C21]|nr:hypothetical protein [Gammaproteobacteria bacterium AH-315-C21]